VGCLQDGRESGHSACRPIGYPVTPGAQHMNRRLLFLCTGNYYRSRFAEMLFNSLAAQVQLNWTADSRGIATERGSQNIGPISPSVLEALRVRGIGVGKDIRFPMQLQEPDLAQADMIIAMDGAEHRPYLEERFPTWAERVEYWHIHDLDGASTDEAFPALEREIHSLIQRVSNESQCRPGSGCGEVDPRVPGHTE
jgi:protein-tyrosine phosphatase